MTYFPGLAPKQPRKAPSRPSVHTGDLFSKLYRFLWPRARYSLNSNPQERRNSLSVSSIITYKRIMKDCAWMAQSRGSCLCGGSFQKEIYNALLLSLKKKRSRDFLCKFILSFAQHKILTQSFVLWSVFLYPCLWRSLFAHKKWKKWYKKQSSRYMLKGQQETFSPGRSPLWCCSWFYFMRTNVVARFFVYNWSPQSALIRTTPEHRKGSILSIQEVLYFL